MHAKASKIRRGYESMRDTSDFETLGNECVERKRSPKKVSPAHRGHFPQEKGGQGKEERD